MPEDSAKDVWITAEAAAQLLGYSKAWIYRLAKQGVITGKKQGHRRLVLASDVHTYQPGALGGPRPHGREATQQRVVRIGDNRYVYRKVRR